MCRLGRGCGASLACTPVRARNSFCPEELMALPCRHMYMTTVPSDTTSFGGFEDSPFSLHYTRCSLCNDAYYPVQFLSRFFRKCSPSSQGPSQISKFPLLLQSSLTMGTEVNLAKSIWGLEKQNWNRVGFVQHGSATGTNPCNASVTQSTTMPPENTAARGRDGTSRVKAWEKSRRFHS